MRVQVNEKLYGRYMKIEHKNNIVVILVDEYRVIGNGNVKFTAGRVDANMGIGAIWVLVCAKRRVPPKRSDASVAVDESVW